MCLTLPEVRPAQAQAQDIPLQILYQDEHLAVVVKPCGMVVHPAAGNPDGTMVNALLKHLDQLSGILSVDGIDAAFIGPSDLAASLGHLGNNGHPDVQAAIASALKTCRDHGKPIGILTTVEADARRNFEEGFAFVAVGSDMGLLARGSEALRDKFRDVIPE